LQDLGNWNSLPTNCNSIPCGSPACNFVIRLRIPSTVHRLDHQSSQELSCVCRIFLLMIQMTRRRRTSRTAAGLGWGPTGIILFLLIASLYALSLGRSMIQLATRIAIVAVIVGLIYVVWYQLAIRNPAFRMGTAGESTIVLLITAVALIFVSDPIAHTVGLTFIPNYSLLQWIDMESFDLANTEIASVFLVLALIVLGLLIFLMLRRKSK
jgi:hypothetical protein